MGKQRKSGTPRPSWSQRMDKLDGIRRDPTTGIVLAREHRHPLADWFRAIPMGVGLPGMMIDPKAEHLFAIHVFDNLQLPAPSDPLYKPRRDRNAPRDIGRESVLWVPTGAPDEDELEDITATEVTVPDVAGYTAAQLAALKAAIKQEEITQAMAAQADDPGAVT